MQVSVCNFLSSSAGFNLCSCFFPAHLLIFRFFLSASAFNHFSRPSVPRPCAASLPLSDPRCFRFLSSASVLGSDYSASVSSFPVSSRFRLTVAYPALPFRFRFLGFSTFRPAWFPMPSVRLFRTQLRCMFPFALPCFAPTAVPQVLASFRSPFGSLLFAFSDPLPFSFDPFRFSSGYLAFCSLFPVLPVPTSQLPFR